MTEETRRVAVVVATHSSYEQLDKCLESMSKDYSVLDGNIPWVITSQGRSREHFRILDKHFSGIRYYYLENHPDFDKMCVEICNQFLGNMNYEWVIIVDDRAVLGRQTISLFRSLLSLVSGDVRRHVGFAHLRNPSYILIAVPREAWLKFGQSLDADAGFTAGLRLQIRNTHLMEARWSLLQESGDAGWEEHQWD